MTGAHLGDDAWAGVDGAIGVAILSEASQCLEAYRAKPNLVEQDAGIEISNVEGGYGRKQLHELLQNGADAMISNPGRISVVLTEDALYCANQGQPIAPPGIAALMASHLSTKRSDQIGRFGLGFKSVLGLSDAPEIISRSGSLRFDRAQTRRRILEVVPSAQRTPVLRLAEPIDAPAAAAHDPVLRELMEWASTVVRLPLKTDVDWLSDELDRFPAEFLLFTEHVLRLDLDDRITGRRRGWTARREGARVRLDTGAGSEGWHVFRQRHRPSPSARADAGEIAGRDEVSVVWAVPDKGRALAGQFWAFFPTNSRTTLSGVVNAPFKTTEDRHDILDGPYNREILEQVLPRMIAENLGDLVEPDDPCSILEILPARGREARSWADDALNEPVMRAVTSAPCIPDMSGVPRRITQVNLSPRFLAERGRWATMWAGVDGGPVNWIHPSVDDRTERRAKATRLFEMARVAESTTEQWLEALAGTSTRGSMVAVQLADQINIGDADQLTAVRRAATVLCGDGKRVPPLAGKLFLPDPTDTSPGAGFVAKELTEDVETVAALRRLGIRPLDAVGRLTAHIARMTGGPVSGSDVGRLWELVRQVDADEAVRALEAGFGRRGTPLRTMAAKPAPLNECLLPGTVVPSDGSRDAEVAVDMRFHAADHQLLSRLGAVSGPRLVSRIPEETWFDEWRQEAESAFMRAAAGWGVRVSQGSIAIRPGPTAAHIGLLPKLSTPAKVAMTREVMALAHQSWTVYSETRGSIEPVLFVNPGVWWVRRHGMVDTPLGPCTVTGAVGPIEGVAADLLPVPVGLDANALTALSVRTSVDGDWWSRFLVLAQETLDLAKVHRLYAAAARGGCARPPSLRVEHDSGMDSAPAGEVVVTDDPVAYGLLRDSIDVVLVDDDRDADVLRTLWELGDARSMLRRAVLHAPSGDPISVVDRFPGLRVTAPTLAPSYQLLACRELAIEVVAEEGTTRSVTDQRFVVEAETLYFRDDMPTADLLEAVNVGLRLGLDRRQLEQTVEIGKRREQSDVARSVRAAGSVDDKLLALAGEVELRKLVPAEAIEVAQSRQGRALEPVEIARMARTAAGTGILRRLGPAIEARGMTVPTVLNGGSTAAAFTQKLGLPEEFAGSRTAQREAVKLVDGPVRLPRLHDYQEETINRVRRVFRADGLARGLVALPTGSGKTRVAVEAVIDHIREEDPEALVVWIAQSDELCEQAVETLSYVWRAVGAHQTELTVNRLWASNDAARVNSGAQVVVATDDKLTSLSTQTRYDWLKTASIVIVDEAHTSVSKTYTALFNWLERGTRQRERPLLGLSATPYRGTNEDQTKQLVNRYDGNLLTDGLFDDDPHVHLQKLGILARVRHKELVGMKLTPLRNRLAGDPGDGVSLLENRIDLNQVAMDEDRNSRIIDSLLQLEAGTTALVFAASVQHAEILASVLSNEGLPAAAVSSYTSPAERREMVRQFRSGEVRVLTNYNVLSQGFDAPKVGAVYVARPTFSLNRYQQMIGRGLRGPRNGGSEEVLIVNVRDNIDAFGEQLAFHHFDALWREGV
ncbi:DEAD/DEAH box helicase [Modestobacter sp. VKM Ac-2983]|uniref:DEAD/DEAH box helicase family protein n=1 Tax=Modestobacter sp. VKM Ac-2983 TaxID=3004137 RepID=UPI0022ABC571|nr:DEAD/DEAH box helicase family protein [Modestobacter sp. VKM Ac-2983]MCZ2804847.1 DEAD/DEAH box helicase [Modestobacter sp. VKM Ac-2983]